MKPCVRTELVHFIEFCSDADECGDDGGMEFFNYYLISKPTGKRSKSLIYFSGTKMHCRNQKLLVNNTDLSCVEVFFKTFVSSPLSNSRFSLHFVAWSSNKTKDKAAMYMTDSQTFAYLEI